MKLLLTGFVQVYFVALNTYFISKLFLPGVLVCGFIISLIWSWNIKRVVFGSIKERLFYSLGASLGSAAGMLSSCVFLKLL